MASFNSILFLVFVIFSTLCAGFSRSLNYDSGPCPTRAVDAPRPSVVALTTRPLLPESTTILTLSFDAEGPTTYITWVETKTVTRAPAASAIFGGCVASVLHPSDGNEGLSKPAYKSFDSLVAGLNLAPRVSLLVLDVLVVASVTCLVYLLLGFFFGATGTKLAGPVGNMLVKQFCTSPSIMLDLVLVTGIVMAWAAGKVTLRLAKLVKSEEDDLDRIIANFQRRLIVIAKLSSYLLVKFWEMSRCFGEFGVVVVVVLFDCFIKAVESLGCTINLYEALEREHQANQELVKRRQALEDEVEEVKRKQIKAEGASLSKLKRQEEKSNAKQQASAKDSRDRFASLQRDYDSLLDGNRYIEFVNERLRKENLDLMSQQSREKTLEEKNELLKKKNAKQDLEVSKIPGLNSTISCLQQENNDLQIRVESYRQRETQVSQEILDSRATLTYYHDTYNSFAQDKMQKEAEDQAYIAGLTNELQRVGLEDQANRARLVEQDEQAWKQQQKLIEQENIITQSQNHISRLEAGNAILMEDKLKLQEAIRIIYDSFFAFVEQTGQQNQTGDDGVDWTTTTLPTAIGHALAEIDERCNQHGMTNDCDRTCKRVEAVVSVLTSCGKSRLMSLFNAVQRRMLAPTTRVSAQQVETNDASKKLLDSYHAALDAMTVKLSGDAPTFDKKRFTPRLATMIKKLQENTAKMNGKHERLLTIFRSISTFVSNYCRGAERMSHALRNNKQTSDAHDMLKSIVQAFVQPGEGLHARYAAASKAKFSGVREDNQSQAHDDWKHSVNLLEADVHAFKEVLMPELRRK